MTRLVKSTGMSQRLHTDEIQRRCSHSLAKSLERRTATSGAVPRWKRYAQFVACFGATYIIAMFLYEFIRGLV